MQADAGEITQVVLWKLGLTEVADVQRATSILDALLKKPDNPVEQIINQIAIEIVGSALKLEIAKMSPRIGDAELKASVLKWWKGADANSRQRIQASAKNCVSAHLKKSKGHETSGSGTKVVNAVNTSQVPRAGTHPTKLPPPLPNSPPSPVPHPVPTAQAASNQNLPVQVPPVPAMAVQPPPVQTPNEVHSQSSFSNNSGDDSLSSSGLQWRALPLPENEPEFHEECAQSSTETVDGLKLIGARVRGKKHKHEGTHCDDWYEHSLAGRWTLLAVSDGGGSYRFSRLGARVSCQAAISTLEHELKEHRIVDREKWEASSFQEADIEKINLSLIHAMQAAWKAIQNAVEERKNSPDYVDLLGRELTTKDLYCTLLLAVHTKVKYHETTRDLVFSLAVGDGMVGVVDNAGKPLLLMTPDSGEHSGEVRFVDDREIAPDRLRNKIFPALCHLGALMVMSDGVSDDYFPNKPGMSRLYGDLVLNGVLEAPLVETNLPTPALAIPEDLKLEQITSVIDLPNLDGTTRAASVLSFDKLCKVLGLEAEELVRDLPRFSALMKKFRLAEELPEVALRIWLENYHVRGSFDDRTLLVLAR